MFSFVSADADAKFILFKGLHELPKGVALFLDLFLGRITFHTGMNMFR